MRTLRLIALATAATCTACIHSDLTADAGVTVTGTADSATGGPFAGAKVVLVKEPDLGEAFGGVFEIITTLGIACLSTNPPALCEQGFTDTTSASGTFSFALTGAQTQGSVDDADTFLLSTKDVPGAGQVDGASVTESFIINATDLALPDLRLWEPAIAFSGTATSANVTFGTLPSADGTGAATGVTFTAASGALVWTQPVDSGAAIDARLLEDAQGNVAATATASGMAADTSVTFNYQSGAVAFAGAAGPAPSRGAACFIQGLSGPVAVTPCSLTDGDFGTPITLQACSGQSCSTETLNNWAYVDLGSAKPFTLVVVRGVQSPSLVESSTDAMSWSALSPTAQSGVFSQAASTTARYVRVHAQSTSADVTGLAEVSVW